MAGTLRLSVDDRLRLESSIRTLLAPLDHVDVDEWRLAVNRQVGALLGADMATFLLPLENRRLAYSEHVPRDTLEQYPVREPRLPWGQSIWERQVALGVWNRQNTYRHLLPEYYRSEYYNEFCVPARGHDSIGITISPIDRVEPRRLAGLMFHHERRTGPRFGGRGIALLRLLLPSFRAGVDSCLQFEQHRSALAHNLDALGQAMLIANSAGRVVHQTPELARTSAGDPDGDQLLDGMCSVARSLAGDSCGSGTEEVPKASREIQTRVARYRLSGSRLPTGFAGTGDHILVALTRLTPEPPSDERLRERFGLTPSQIRVARLLGEGRSNAEVARVLTISSHTAERHTERVLNKLGVRSRAAVGAVLMRG